MKIKTHQTPEESERIKVTQHCTNLRSGSLAATSPRLGSTNEDVNHDATGIKADAVQGQVKYRFVIDMDSL